MKTVKQRIRTLLPLPKPTREREKVHDEILHAGTSYEKINRRGLTIDQVACDVAESEIDIIPARVLMIVAVPEEYEMTLEDRCGLVCLFDTFKELNANVRIDWSLDNNNSYEEVSVSILITEKNKENE